MNSKSLPVWVEEGEDAKGLPSSKVIASINDMPPNVHGFIYRIRFVDGTQYIGKKNVYSTRTVAAKKNGKPRDKVESNWKIYCGSSKECQNRVPVKREILDYAFNKYQLTYKETEALFFYQVLEDNTYLNDNILGKFFPRQELFDDGSDI